MSQPSRPGPSQPHPTQARPAQAQPGQPIPAQAIPAQPIPAQPIPAQPRPAQARPAQARPAPAQPVPATEPSADSESKSAEAELEPVSLVEAESTDDSGVSFASKIKAFGVAGDHARTRTWKRQPKTPGTGAVRVRTFHGKLSDQGLGYLDDAVNDWLDAHPEVEVKFVTSTVGVFEGKIREPALVLNLWY